MIGFLKGKVFSKTPEVVIEAGGIGFELVMADLAKSNLPAQGEDCGIYTYVKYNRDEMPQIFGFIKREEKEIFKMLVSVSGIGPKVSLAILNTFSPAQVVSIILADEVKSLCTVSGLGEKSAKRIIVDLKDKIRKVELEEEIPEAHGVFADAAAALVSLGWQNALSRRVVNEVIQENKDVSTAEEVIKIALSKMGRRI